MQRAISVVLLTFFTARCATVAHGPRQRVHVTSSPAGASVHVACGESRDAGVTPLDIVVPRKSETCHLTLSHPGYADQTVDLRRRMSGVIWLNLLPGFVAGLGAAAASAVNEGNGSEPNAVLVGVTALGMLIDHATGAWYSRSSSTIDVKLDPNTSAAPVHQE